MLFRILVNVILAACNISSELIITLNSRKNCANLLFVKMQSKGGSKSSNVEWLKEFIIMILSGPATEFIDSKSKERRILIFNSLGQMVKEEEMVFKNDARTITQKI